MEQLKGVRRLDETTLRIGGRGDNWHMSWAQNDKQFVSLNDGTGWADIEGYTGKSYNSRVYTIAGDPPDLEFQHLSGFPDLHTETPPNTNRYYGFGILALGSSVYNYLSTPNHVFREPNARFVGAKLIYSPDEGRTWKNQDGSPVGWEPWEARGAANMVFFREPGEAFSLITVLQMGRDYEHNQDGFVYLYAPNGNTEGSMNQLVMCRVPKDRILDRSAYEFFAGRDPTGRSRWATASDERAVVHTFPAGWVNTSIHPYAWHPSVVYNAPLGVYLMANWGMGCSPDRVWLSKPSYLGFWVASAPEGPWEQIYEETEWTPEGDIRARAYQPQIAPKWIAADGKSFWLVWTEIQGDLVDAQGLGGGRSPYYSYNAQRVEILTN